MNIGCATDKGNYRQKNQDRVIAKKKCIENHELAIACVCDGIGSLSYSEIASEMVTKGVLNWIDGVTRYYPSVMSTDELIEDLEVTIRELNDLVCEYKEENKIEVGCTMSLLCIVDKDYFIFHVGDSRIYCIQDRLIQLTQDEVVLRQKNRKEKNYLINYIGKEENLFIHKGKGKAEKGSVYMLCSDGLYKHLSYGDVSNIYQINGDTAIENIAQGLVYLMMERGEKDNISCVILKV